MSHIVFICEIREIRGQRLVHALTWVAGEPEARTLCASGFQNIV